MSKSILTSWSFSEINIMIIRRYQEFIRNRNITSIFSLSLMPLCSLHASSACHMAASINNNKAKGVVCILCRTISQTAGFWWEHSHVTLSMYTVCYISVTNCPHLYIIIPLTTLAYYWARNNSTEMNHSTETFPVS